MPSGEKSLLTLAEELRHELARIDTYVSAADELAHEMSGGAKPGQRRNLERLSIMISDAAQVTNMALDEADRRLAPVGRVGAPDVVRRPRSSPDRGRDR
jgi:hypothetical protein